jgi:hypothetical protein
LAVQFAVVMATVLPPMAEIFSARELARHFNQQGCVPSRLLVAEGRIGSLVFYLDPRIRATLTADQVQQLPAIDLPPLVPGDVVAVPQHKLPKLQAHRNLDGNPYETVGPYRLYSITKPRPVVAPKGNP